MAAFEPTTFDKAVSRVLTYLKTERKLMYSAFAEQTGILPQVISQIVGLTRGVPTHRIDMVSYILTDKYKVNPDFLRTNNGPFLAEPLPVKAEEVPQYFQVVNENTQLRKQIEDLERQLQNYKQITDSQSSIIESLKDAVKSAKKSAK